MSAASLVRYAYLARLSQPRAERALYKAIRRGRATRLVEIGLGDLARSERMIAVAARHGAVHFTGIDLFEARPGMLALKSAHRRLKATGARVRLVPGEPGPTLTGLANGLTGTDLVVISPDWEATALEAAWNYLPRMLHDRSTVFVGAPDVDGDVRYERLGLEDLEARARSKRSRRAA